MSVCVGGGGVGGGGGYAVSTFEAVERNLFNFFSPPHSSIA